MTIPTDKVLALAKEAGFYVPDANDQAYSADTYDGLCTPELVKFAALIQREMEAEGYRKCAEGQRTTQFCSIVEKLKDDLMAEGWIPPEIRSEKWSANDKG